MISNGIAVSTQSFKSPLHSTPLALWRGVGGEAFPSEGSGEGFTYKNHPS